MHDFWRSEVFMCSDISERWQSRHLPHRRNEKFCLLRCTFTNTCTPPCTCLVGLETVRQSNFSQAFKFSFREMHTSRTVLFWRIQVAQFFFHMEVSHVELSIVRGLPCSFLFFYRSKVLWNVTCLLMQNISIPPVSPSRTFDFVHCLPFAASQTQWVHIHTQQQR